ncbi:hypothetical protein BDZ91DRAFT_748434 [Kalaharituber pfeilii]|nr:hypothetical protein BDZ91DRAFT_748434 [Kalaharituber pfeilii]
MVNFPWRKGPPITLQLAVALNYCTAIGTLHEARRSHPPISFLSPLAQSMQLRSKSRWGLDGKISKLNEFLQ